MMLRPVAVDPVNESDAVNVQMQRQRLPSRLAQAGTT